MDDLSIPTHHSSCLHRRVVLDITGGMHFSGGEVHDNIQERLLCLDCMEYVAEAEVRCSQRDNNPLIHPTFHMEVSHDSA